ncbi:sulfatase-like hydrolase/transferase [Maribacter sp. MAR_2009_72]|uniref:sulfatase-like hydrolase/transferase n=1 Tax=Maribacter sp. MAR_2009_72 TaxID=1250050 RepID=UPI00119AF6B5|nr:sulfatase-like hydrolase/transferase [Maribacter sp. MAR_2009_72]TVZ16560.1 arylsulfatase A-like enzyme [Maribacter sp. MAR_2009_72]
MCRYILLLTLTLFLSCNDEKKEVVKATTPNILVIIADDAGWNDVGYNGSEIFTPNIDVLAKEGIQLNRFYVNPTCSPSRASFLTGRPASRIGIVAPISNRSEISLPDSIVTLPQQLKKYQYQTALFGKWHLGLKPSSGPKKYGFDYSYGFLHGQIDQYSHEYKNGDPSWHKNGIFISEEGHATDLIGTEAINWLTKHRDTTKSFYVQLAYSAPHFPLQETEAWKKPYVHSIKNSSRRDFAAAMSHMDNNIGKVLNKLDDLGLTENTIILFMSDNGAMENWFPSNQYEGRHAANDVLGSNTPLKDWKTSNYEGAIRVPAVLYWKGMLNPGISNNYISAIDMMPTILDLAGIDEIPALVEGRNIWPTLTGKDSLNSSIYVRGHLQESIIVKPWKLIRTRHLTSDTEYELYNIELDPEETNNVVKEQEALFSSLKVSLEDQFQLDDQNVNLDIQ